MTRSFKKHSLRTLWALMLSISFLACDQVKALKEKYLGPKKETAVTQQAHEIAASQPVSIETKSCDTKEDYSFAYKLRYKRTMLEQKERELEAKELALNARESQLKITQEHNEISKNKENKQDKDNKNQEEVKKQLHVESQKDLNKKQDLDKFANVVSSMKQDAAVKMMLQLDKKTAAKLMTRVNKDKAAQFLSNMPAEQAAQITQTMAQEELDPMPVTHQSGKDILEVKEELPKKNKTKINQTQSTEAKEIPLGLKNGREGR